MRCYRPLQLLLLLLLVSVVPVAAQAPPLTQRDWMINLVDTLNLAYGLPDQPSNADYLRLLDGRRTFRFEAEEVRNPEDLVAINCFNSFGSFSGSGWLCGLATPTQTSFRFLLPRSGHYRFAAAVRLAGHTLRLDNRTFRIDATNGNDFHRVELGEVQLTAGLHTLEIDLPANGSIDYFEFSAADFPPVAPLAGWQPERALDNETLAVTSARLLALEGVLPPTDERLRFEAELEAGIDPAIITDQQHLGSPTGGRWIRNTTRPLELLLHVTPPQTAVYEILLRAAGDKGLSGTVNTRFHWSAPFPSYLAEKTIGSYLLEAQPQTLLVRLPPRGGIDSVILRRRLSSGSDYCTLLGLPQNTTPIQGEQIDRLLLLLSRLSPQSE